MPTRKEEFDENLRKITERGKVADFAVKVLKLETTQAEVFSKACADRFEWDGVSLQFKGANGNVPCDDEQCTGFFQREYAFLFPAKQAGSQDHPEIDATLLASAKAGNITAQGRIVRDYLGGDVKALDAILADKGHSDGDGAPGANGAGADNIAHAGNPFTKLRDSKGQIVPAVEKQIESMIRHMGTKKVTDIARAAKSPAAPFGLSITGLPLRS